MSGCRTAPEQRSNSHDSGPAPLSLAARRRSIGRPLLDMTVVNPRSAAKDQRPAADGDRTIQVPAFDAAYEMGPIIGAGTTSVVRRATRRYGGKKEVAVKCIFSREEETLQFARDEYHLLRDLRHPSVIRVMDQFETSSSIWTCMELCVDGSVEQYMEKSGPFEESDALALFLPLLKGLNYLHGKRIVHRDIKPANVLLQHDATSLKITDFNSAKRIGRGPGSSLMLTDRGTHLYCAPELRFGRLWNERIDIWSCGLCFFFMLRADLPFDVGSRGVAKSLLLGKLPDVKWDNISDLTRNLIAQCLTVNMRDRPPAMELLAHPSLDRFNDDLGCVGLWRDVSIGSTFMRDSSLGCETAISGVMEDYEFYAVEDDPGDIFALIGPCGCLSVRLTYSRNTPRQVVQNQFRLECSSTGTNETHRYMHVSSDTPETALTPQLSPWEKCGGGFMQKTSDCMSPTLPGSPRGVGGFMRKTSECISPTLPGSPKRVGRRASAAGQFQKEACPFKKFDCQEVLRKLARIKYMRSLNIEKTAEHGELCINGLKRCWSDVALCSGDAA